MNFPSEEEFVEQAKSNPKALYQYISTIVLELNNSIQELKEIVNVQQEKIKILENRLNQNSKNSNKPPSSDLYKKENSTRKTSRRKSGGQEGHQGHHLKMVEEPTNTHFYPAPDHCSRCGKDLLGSKVKTKRFQEFELPEISIEINEHQIEQKICSCGHCNTSNLAPSPSNHVYYGSKFKALVVYLKNVHMMPYQRTKQLILDLLNHSISEGTFWNAEKDFSSKVEPIINEIKENIIQSSSAGFDETGIRAENKNHWVHVATTNHYSYFYFHKKRSKEAIDLAGILPYFQGVAIHDFYKTYLKYRCSHAFCNAHILRELIAISETSKNTWVQMMLALLIIGLDAKTESESNELTESQIVEINQLFDKAIEKGIIENHSLIQIKKKGSKELNLLKRLKEYKTEILRFLTSPEIPFDNNRSERAIRMIKVKAKVSGGFRSFSGGQFFCLARSFLETMKKQKIPIFQSIVSVFNGQPLTFSV